MRSQPVPHRVKNSSRYGQGNGTVKLLYFLARRFTRACKTRPPPLIICMFTACVRLFVHAGQCHAVLPEQLSSSVVLRPRRRDSRCGLIKVLSRCFGYVWRGREIDNRFCTPSGRNRE